VFITEGIKYNSGTGEREGETKQRPYEDNTGPQTSWWHKTRPVDLMFGKPEDNPDQPTVQLPDYVTNLEERLRIVHELVRNS